MSFRLSLSLSLYLSISAFLKKTKKEVLSNICWMSIPLPYTVFLLHSVH
jgi:hypothetical protein